MLVPMKNAKTRKEIPIFFSTDDNYIPFLDVAVRSLVLHASSENRYRIIVLNTGLKEENVRLVKANETDFVTVEFLDISEKVEKIKSHFKNIYHFSVVTYYRLFIASLFPEYGKVIYLDCDLVVLDDVAKLYDTDLEGNILGGARENFIYTTPEFRRYAKEAVGVDPADYINAGVLLIDLDAFRRARIEETFVHLIKTYNFDTVDPDQAYLNFLCSGKIKMLSSAWNKEPLEKTEGEYIGIMHYALYKKPWQYNDVLYGEYFWEYAEKSPFYREILRIRDAFDDAARASREAAAVEIKQHAMRIVHSGKSFFRTLVLRQMGAR